MAHPHLVAGPGSPGAWRTRLYSWQTDPMVAEARAILNDNNLPHNRRYNLVCCLPTSTRGGVGKWVWQDSCRPYDQDVAMHVDGNMQQLHANGLFTRTDLISKRYLKYYICNYILP